MERLELQYIQADHSIFATEEGYKRLIVFAFVDDIKIIHPQKEVVNGAKRELKAAFKMVDLGPISFYLGMSVTRD